MTQAWERPTTSGISSGCLAREKSASDEKKVVGVPVPSADGFRPDQARSLAISFVAHVKRITVGEIGGDIARIGNGNIGACFPQLDVVAIVFESMRKQTSSALLTSSYSGKQQSPP
jgi:hypothetical protein